MAHISMTSLDELHRKVIQLLKVVARMGELVGGVTWKKGYQNNKEAKVFYPCLEHMEWLSQVGNEMLRYKPLLYYRQVSNIRSTLGNKIVDHSDVVEASPARRCSNYIFILDLTTGFIGWGKDNCTTRRETFKFGNLVQLILEILG